MRTLIFGAGPLGSLYAHILHEEGKDVTILARKQRYEFIQENGIVLFNEHTGERMASTVRVVDRIAEDDSYDLVVVLIRKNKIMPVLQVLSRSHNIRNILFMGNNVLGFDSYFEKLPKERVLFGFPGAGGSLQEQIVHFVDRAKPNEKRRSITIGEPEGNTNARTKQIESFFESSGVPVDIVGDIDGWLKYHAAFILPIAYSLYKHDCDNYALAGDDKGIRQFIRACKEGGRVLRELGLRKRQPFRYNLFYWLPESFNAKIFKELFNSKFAEIGFALHAREGIDEVLELTEDFKTLIDRSAVSTPAINELQGYMRSFAL
ncbi:MAG: ketopantoate reductase family protein [bacterium]|nr:MAG: ketopantoate reductase family protein [bacterium]